MAELQSGMPVMPLTSDMRVQFEAINPTTGVAVAGVDISLAAIYAVDTVGSETDLIQTGPFMLVPGPGAA
jgi:hypothetical protein